METLTLPALSRAALIKKAYDVQGYKGSDYIVVSDRMRGLKAMSDEELITLIEKWTKK